MTNKIRWLDYPWPISEWLEPVRVLASLFIVGGVGIHTEKAHRTESISVGKNTRNYYRICGRQQIQLKGNRISPEKGVWSQSHHAPLASKQLQGQGSSGFMLLNGGCWWRREIGYDDDCCYGPSSSVG